MFLLAVLASAQTIHVDTSHHVNSFRPTEALGAAVDRLPDGAPEKLLSKPVLDKVLQAGWQTVTYRQNTELRIQAWHWNPRGHWSNQAKQQGYFTGDATPSGTLTDSYGYSLPDRGFTRNDGTLSGYSRLTDGDLHTYWKSNPYLTRAFTHEDDSLHPQWVILDLRTPQDINAMRIAWAAPYARTYFVQFWTGSEDPIKNATEGVWETFPSGAITNGKGGTVKLRLSRKPVRARYLRVWMTQSSDTCDDHGSQDRRNCVGYAISEVYAGSIASDGTFHDATRHSPDQRQTTTWCSSIDPWHNASDLDKKAGEQTGFDLFFRSGVTRGLPAMIPIAMLYGTPENSAAEIQYLENRHYPISYVEMGEEPDGQYMLPEDYAALYLQWATALHKVDPKLKLGGPIFTGVNEDIKVWPDAEGRVSWLGRFLDYLKTHGRFSDLAFMSFEHYPFAPCQTTWDDLYKEPYLIKHIMQVWRQDGLPPNV
ncbi:MAG TPA: discoidin domain-containing protein, partial [Bryobacteraceae bacterium]